MTQKELFENVLSELSVIKKSLPNGELITLADDMRELKEDVAELNATLLNPENGVVVKTNKNTWWREQYELKSKVYDQKLVEFESLQKWKDNVNKALWIIFGVLISIVAKMLFSHPL